MTTIYGLYDPHSGQLRYVGRTTRALEQRLAAHLAHATTYRSTTPLQRWLRGLLATGIGPSIRPIVVVSDALADLAERRTIAAHPDLLNTIYNLRAARELAVRP